MSDPTTDPFASRPDAGLSGFICPDGEMIEFGTCLAKCRMAARCAPRPVLQKIGVDWRRTSTEPSTTELIGPTRIAWLKRMYPYYESAASRKWSIFGSAVSVIMEGGGGDEGLTEETFRDATNKGTLDYFDSETGTLWDYKLTGAYKVRQIVTVERPVPGEVFKSGPRKGMPKLERVEDMAGAGARVWTEAPEWGAQLADYSAKATRYGFTVKRACLFLIVRDADMFAEQMSLTKPWYEIEVPLPPVEETERKMKERRALLESALVRGNCPPICTPDERWNGKRCESYCPVRAWCDKHDGEALRQISTTT